MAESPYPTGFEGDIFYVNFDTDEDLCERINASVLCDSLAPNGVRLTTLSVSFPRFVLAEFNTHRMFSRNSASSRAIPTHKLIERVQRNPARPIEWGKNQPGMSAENRVPELDAADLRQEWLKARDSAVAHVVKMLKYHPHKQVVNRLLEPFMTHTVIVTATDWDNFFRLRCAANAQPELRQAAELMRSCMQSSDPLPIAEGQWHLPLVQPDESSLPLEQQKKISAARCARVSYLTHEGTRDIEKDLELCDRLSSEGHLSPFEHVATPAADTAYHANFRGWIQLRKSIEAAHPTTQPRHSTRSLQAP